MSKARTMRVSSLHVHGCTCSEPRSPLAKSLGRMSAGRSTGVAFSLYCSRAGSPVRPRHGSAPTTRLREAVVKRTPPQSGKSNDFQRQDDVCAQMAAYRLAYFLTVVRCCNSCACNRWHQIDHGKTRAGYCLQDKRRRDRGFADGWR